MWGNRMSGKPEVSIDAGTAVIDGRAVPLPKIEMLRMIDSGAHGSVFEARDTSLDRPVAVKIWYRTGEKVSDGAIGEVRKLASLSHPLFVTVYHLEGLAEPPYSIMEYLPGRSLRSWIKARDIPRTITVPLRDYLLRNAVDLRQRCKFWDLYSLGLHYLYSRDLLHGDPHVGNVIVFDDPTKSLDYFLRHRILKYGELSSIRMLDLGTSLLRDNRASTQKREAKVILETSTKLFPDISPTDVMHVGNSLSHERLLEVLDKFIEYVLELTSVPKLSRDDFVMMEHSLPQLLGWCPYFNYKFVHGHLASLFTEKEAAEFMIDTANQMQWKHDELLGVNTSPVPSQHLGGTAPQALTLLTSLSANLRGRGLVTV